MVVLKFITTVQLTLGGLALHPSPVAAVHEVWVVEVADLGVPGGLPGAVESLGVRGADDILQVGVASHSEGAVGNLVTVVEYGNLGNN